MPGVAQNQVKPNDHRKVISQQIPSDPYQHRKADIEKCLIRANLGLWPPTKKKKTPIAMTTTMSYLYTVTNLYWLNVQLFQDRRCVGQRVHPFSNLFQGYNKVWWDVVGGRGPVVQIPFSCMLEQSWHVVHMPMAMRWHGSNQQQKKRTGKNN